MKLRLAIAVALAMLFGVAAAQPTTTTTTPPAAKAKAKAKPARRPSKKKPAPAPAPAPPVPAPEAPPPEPALPPPEVTPPDATPAPGATPASAPLGGAAPGETARAAPPMAPRLAMRPKQAHDGFVDSMDCSACHTAEGWKLAQTAGASGFDHDRTGFPLRGSHVQTQCNGCHTGLARPVTNCEGCHKDPHQGRNDGTCAECHTAVAWSDTNTLERHRRTRMPLTGRHALIDCAACHKRQAERVFSDTPTDCYACHRDRYHDKTVHPNHDGSAGGAMFPRDCGLCHRTTGWSPATTDPTMLPGIGTMARLADHDSYFVLTTGSHRTAECSACHPDPRRTQLVRCDGCHLDTEVRAQHRQPVARTASACLRCHPRGAAR